MLETYEQYFSNIFSELPKTLVSDIYNQPYDSKRNKK